MFFNYKTRRYYYLPQGLHTGGGVGDAQGEQTGFGVGHLPVAQAQPAATNRLAAIAIAKNRRISISFSHLHIKRAPHSAY